MLMLGYESLLLKVFKPAKEGVVFWLPLSIETSVEFTAHNEVKPVIANMVVNLMIFVMSFSFIIIM